MTGSCHGKNGLYLEGKKIKRTGFYPAFLAGGLLSAAFPVINLAVRPEGFFSLEGSPFRILMQANWQLMAMINVLLVLTGACIMYHTEHSGNAILKMSSLPLREGSLFLGKALVMASVCAVVLLIEAASVLFCTIHWFGEEGMLPEVLIGFGFSFLMLLPALLCSLLIASVCKNMWVSLGIGVVCIFLATMLPKDDFVLSLFPFAMPFQEISGEIHKLLQQVPETVWKFSAAAGAESALFIVLEFVFLKVSRRWF